MFTKKSIITLICIAAMLSFGFVIPGNNSVQEGPIKMEYKMKAGDSIAYTGSIKVLQETDHPSAGLITTEINSESNILLKFAERTNNNMITELSFISLDYSIEASLGGSPPTDTEGVLNKPLILKTGLRGEKPELTNIKELPSVIDGGAPAATGLSGLVVEIAEKSLSVGDTWVVDTEQTIELPEGELKTTSSTKYTFSGFDKKLDYNCIKITGITESTVEGAVTQGGTDIEISTKGTGTSTLFFAIEEGIFVDMSGKSSGETDLFIPVANLIIPRTETTESRFSIKK